MRTRHRERGQVLAIFAGGMLGLLAVAALAIDLSSAYSTRQTEKAAADAAALAGAQDLPMTGAPSVAVATRARLDALTDVAGRFGVPVPGCPTNVNITNCPLTGTPYVVSISTPSHTTGSSQSLQVTIDHPTLQLSFASLFGKSTCAALRADFCRQTSVAVNDRAPSYALMLLRPSPTGSDVVFTLSGNSTSMVTNGDVGINGNMNYNGSGSLLSVAGGYGLRYYADASHGPQWGTNPAGTKLTSYIQDPKYPIPSRANPPDSGHDTSATCTTDTSILSNDAYYKQFVPKEGVTCYKPGIYTSQLSVPNGSLAILEPGLYFLDGGLDLKGTIIGGWVPAPAPGVALVFPSSGQVIKITGSNNNMLLNAGAKLESPPGQEASPARDYQNKSIVTNTNPQITMTLMVQKETSCFGPGGVVTAPTACTSGSSSLKLTGTGALYLAGVQYAPTTDIEVHGQSSGTGYVGQLVAWTLLLAGGASVDQEGVAQPKNGVLRLTDDCSGPGTLCVSP